VSVGRGLGSGKQEHIESSLRSRRHLKLTNLARAVVLAGLQGREVVLVATTTAVVEGHAALLTLGEVPLGQFFTAITSLLRERTAVWGCGMVKVFGAGGDSDAGADSESRHSK